MRTIAELLNQDGFLKNMFEAIPCGVLIVDRDRRIRAVNNTIEQTFGATKADVINRRGGDIFKCINASKTPEGCGFAEECRDCQVRKTALEAIAGKKLRRNKGNLHIYINGRASNMEFLISAAPFDHDGERLAIIILEDITELNSLRRRLKAEQSFAGIIGRNIGMNALFQTIRDVTDVNVPVLILGESGTGKELVASAIHSEGPRADKPFVPVNCAALPEGILESELFGHVKGAFTGAIRDKRGRFELAHGGTMFLDEVGDLPKTVQAKLLRVLQEGRFERVGDEKSISVDVRIISASNRDLKREVKKGNFRDDLYYRLNVVPIHLPPLRKRKDDIPLLVNHFLGNNIVEGIKSEGLSKEALALMMEYPWPGNVRELQSAIRFALVKSRGEIIQPDDLPMELRDWVNTKPRRGPSRKLNRESVRAAMEKSGGNKAKAARILGVGRATLYRFLIDFPDVS